MVDNFPEISDMELIKLRKENEELKKKVEEMELVLEEAGLKEKKPQPESDELVTINKQLKSLRELSDKGIPLMLEDIKILEVLIKSKAVIQGKALPLEEKTKKKAEKPDIAKLLQIAGAKE